MEQQNNKVGTLLLGMILGILLSLLLGSAAYAGVKIYSSVNGRNTRQASTDGQEEESLVSEESLEKLEAIESVIEEYYYKDEDIQTDAMIDGMYSGVVESLQDPYSVYYTAEEWNQLMEETEGIYYGIGAYVSLDTATSLAKISGVIAGTPAEEVGLRENDIIYLVDSESVQGLELSEVVSRIKGEENTTVHLTLIREGETDYVEVDVTRRKIESPTVNSEMYEDGTAYIQITEFDDVTVKQFQTALEEIKKEDAKGLILDLRSNPGGSLAAVVDIARQILPSGMIVYTEDKNGQREEFTCDGKNEWKLPLVVLVNGNSASASEILAGAIKDYGIGRLVGTTTFGKGIVQRILPLTDGTALKLTISAYYTPKGNNIHGTGIEPDVVCEFDSEAYYDGGEDNQLEKAKEEMRKMRSMNE